MRQVQAGEEHRPPSTHLTALRPARCHTTCPCTLETIIGYCTQLPEPSRGVDTICGTRGTTQASQTFPQHKIFQIQIVSGIYLRPSVSPPS